jgi:RNA polymerase sigma-70 factor (ECF subfamily)
MQQSPDDELAIALESVASGDRAAFRKLYQQAGPVLFRICTRMLRDRDAAQDALQEAMVRIWQKSHLFRRDKGGAMGWMTAVTRNVVFNRLPALRPAISGLSDQELTALIESYSTSPDPAMGPDLRRCLALLEQNYRRCVVLAYHYGMSYEELAAQKAVPLGTIKTWIHRAIGQLQRCLNQ